MRTIRVKQENQEAIIAGLQKGGFEAAPAKCPPSEEGYERAIDYPSKFKEIIEQDSKGMTGVETSASGHQAHKIISALKEQGIIN
jgi:hypothetical protein